MNRPSTLTWTTVALLCLGIALPASANERRGDSEARTFKTCTLLKQDTKVTNGTKFCRDVYRCAGSVKGAKIPGGFHYEYSNWAICIG